MLPGPAQCPPPMLGPLVDIEAVEVVLLDQTRVGGLPGQHMQPAHRRRVSDRGGPYCYLHPGYLHPSHHMVRKTAALDRQRWRGLQRCRSPATRGELRWSAPQAGRTPQPNGADTSRVAADAGPTVYPFGSEPFVRLREQFWTSVFTDTARIGRSMTFRFTPEATVRPGFAARCAG